MQTVYGGPTEGAHSAQVVAEDTEVVERIKHTLRPGEQLGQWYARVGLGRDQILHMNASEISRFVAIAEARNSDDPFQETRISRSPLPSDLAGAIIPAV